MSAERSAFYVREVGEHGSYRLFSEKYDRAISMVIAFIGVGAPDVGARIEMPDGMLRMEEGAALFTCRFLSFAKPSEKHTIPEGFDIEEDYAYITYRDGEERVLLQRVYG